MNLDLIPRLEPDYYCETLREALAEMERRKTFLDAGDAVSRVVESPFGGFRVLTVSRALAVEFFTVMAEQGVGSLPDFGVGSRAMYR